MPKVRKKVPMTKQEGVLLKFDDLLRDVGLDYMIFASSLLHIIRGGKLDPTDVEIDFAFHGDDLTDDIISKFRASGFYGVMYPCKEKYGEFYLWEHPGDAASTPRIAMNPIWSKRGVVYQNVVNEECLVWDPKFYPKETWSTIKYLGREFNAPSDPREWLEKWYGVDWETPLSCTWRDNKNRKDYKDLWTT